MDLMGDSQSMNNRRAPPPEVRYTSRSGNKEEKVELDPSLIAEKIREACSGKMIG